MTLGRFWESLKHPVLDRAHPLPPRIDVHPGTPGTLDHAITRAVLGYVALEGLRERAFGAEHAPGVPAAWPNGDADEGGEGVAGCLATSRYLGRLWRLYPVSPPNALLVDSALDLLDGVRMPLVDDATPWTDVATALEASFDDASPYILGFGTPTLADVCWLGAFRWAKSTLEFDVSDEATARATPRLAAWWAHVTTQKNDEQ